MGNFSPGMYDQMERAILDGRRVAVVRGSREVVVVPLRLFMREGREFLEARHPTTGDVLVIALDEMDRFEVVRS